MIEMSEPGQILHMMLRGEGLAGSIRTFDNNIDSEDPDVQRACIMGLGLLAMRFNYFYEEGYNKVISKYKDSLDPLFIGALEDLEDYVDSFVK